MLSSRALEQFIVLAEELHFGKAANRLHISQPPLSQAIMRIEQTIGVQLFLRESRSVSLTDAGSVFLVEARRLVEQQELAIAHTREACVGMTGRISLGFVGSVSYGLLPELLSKFRRTYPDIVFDLRELPSSGQLSAFRTEQIELGIVRLPLSNANDLEMKVIKRERMIAVLPVGHPLAKRQIIDLKLLVDETFMMFPSHLVLSLHAKTMMACHAAGFSPRTGLEAWQMPTMVSLIAAQMGIALLPEQVKHIPHPGVVYRDVTGDEGHLNLEIALAWRPQNRSKICQQVIDVIPVA
ncbi:LysR family transcriptional regulator [Paraburkholderia acidicola]|uniref:LysR family transcriptional regulator n=1 Tax=Paraburkholderia acidicola TaxID=1912599 RepID=A0ABV1LWV3_9BURK